MDWLALDVAECTYAEVVSRKYAASDEPYWGRLVDRAHRRIMRSIRTPAQAGRMRLPSVVEVTG